MKLIFGSSAILLALAGCGTASTTANDPEAFKIVHSGAYDAAKQPVMVDCVFDGFLSSQNIGLASHVRQVKRANGYRIDVIVGPFQYVVADIRDDGVYELMRSKHANLVDLDKEEAASKACVEKFGKVTFSAPARQGSNNPYATGR